MSHTIRPFALLLAMLCAATLVYAQVNRKWRTRERYHSIANEVLPRSVPQWKPESISFRKPDGLMLSTGNLYFTSHDAAGAAVWRTSQTSIPGQDSVLYWEQGARFGDIIWAEVDGNFFGYFFAKKQGVITIRRVPLGGGITTVLATVTNVNVENSHRNLINDDNNLYWQDYTAIKRMPIRGGPVTVLETTGTNHRPAGLSMQPRNGIPKPGKVLIYADGADIRFIPLTGIYVSNPVLRTIVTAGSRVTTLQAIPNGVYWGEENGSVKLKLGDTTTALHSSGGVPTSISTNGAEQAWTQCGANSCQLTFNFAGPGTIGIGTDAFGVTVPSSGKVFWGDAAGVHRLF